MVRGGDMTDGRCFLAYRHVGKKPAKDLALEGGRSGTSESTNCSKWVSLAHGRNVLRTAAHPIGDLRLRVAGDREIVADGTRTPRCVVDAVRPTGASRM